MVERILPQKVYSVVHESSMYHGWRALNGNKTSQGGESKMED